MSRFLSILALLLVSINSYARLSIGTPFFKNYSSKVYNAHNRNFDILCEKDGYVYVANFEGLLVYDNVKWRILHTPGISRVVSLSKDEKGRIWFSGINVKGCVEGIVGDSIQAYYTQSDKYASKETVILAPVNQNVDRWNGIEVRKRLKISKNRTILATASAGVIAIDDQDNKVWEINEEKGLCSNSVTTIDYDGKGTVWGATDNGLFRISTTEIYTQFGEAEGLRGQVSSIAEAQGRLFVGTLQGLFWLEDDHFVKLPGMDQACWQLDETVRGSIIAATTNGVFTYDDHISLKSQNMSLTLLVENDNSFLSGEMDGIYRRTYDRQEQLIDPIPNVVKMKKDDRGGIWALTMGGEHYYMPAKKDHFTRQNNGILSLLLDYTDDKGMYWHCNDDGMGLVMDGMSKELASWLQPLAGYSIQALFIKDGIVWIGGNFGLIRLALDETRGVKLRKPQVFIRSFMHDERYMYMSMSNDIYNSIGTTLYSFRLHNNDPWSKWSVDKDIELHNMGYGWYQLSVRSLDPYGQISESEEITFEIPYPIYVRWYAILLYVILFGFITTAYFKYRTRMILRRQEQLEEMVSKRTQEVVQQKNEIESQKNEIELQKNEIEEKSNRLETTLEELRDAQHELLRKEHEATVGKLTKGLIDRILNPMNYINNFSHLTLGLTKDMKENLEDEKEKMDSDNYEDCMDVLSMMTQNLEKIEQHGVSTARIIKAMEEMLKERSDKIEPTDVAALCTQVVEIARKYYHDDIEKYNISVEWQKPELPIVADVNAELMSKVIASMIHNSVYAVIKKADRLISKGEKYDPVVRISIQPHSGEMPPYLDFYDNGIGIEEGIIDKIFDPFFTTKPTSEAPGVGLYLSQQIIQDFGGNIKVKSEKNHYTNFTITLP